MAVRYSKEQRDDAIARLREWLKPGDTVYTVLRSRSRSGMQRTIGVLGIQLPKPEAEREPWEYNEPHILDYTYNVARALGLRDDKRREGVVIGGCGMDMGFKVVYDLSNALFPGGVTCIGPGCPANDHANGDEGRSPHPHRDGGYALKQRWI